MRMYQLIETNEKSLHNAIIILVVARSPIFVSCSSGCRNKIVIADYVHMRIAHIIYSAIAEKVNNFLFACRRYIANYF